MRAAIFFTPPRDHPLTRTAAGWLGRDAFADEVLPVDEEQSRLTAEPRRYGFHATMKAPFRLAPGRRRDELETELADFCRREEPRDIAALRLARLERFFALVPDRPSAGVDALAANVVEAFEPFRAPLTDEEIARRRRTPMSPVQKDHLERWGYPHVFGEFRFHMTLTGPVPPQDRETVEAALRARFGAFIGRPLSVDGLALFVQPTPDDAFVVEARHPLGGDRLRAS